MREVPRPGDCERHADDESHATGHDGETMTVCVVGHKRSVVPKPGCASSPGRECLTAFHGMHPAVRRQVTAGRARVITCHEAACSAPDIGYTVVPSFIGGIR